MRLSSDFNVIDMQDTEEVFLRLSLSYSNGLRYIYLAKLVEGLAIRAPYFLSYFDETYLQTGCYLQ